MRSSTPPSARDSIRRTSTPKTGPVPTGRRSRGIARAKDKHGSFESTPANTPTSFSRTRYDVVFAAGMDEIMRKFEALKSPIVFAAECYCWPNLEQAALYPPSIHRCKYLNAGMWIATTEAALPFTEELAAIASKREKDDQQIVVDMFLSGKHPIELDRTCSIAFCCNMDSLNYLRPEGDRMITIDTAEKPCLFHGNGASDLRGICAVIAP